MSRNINTEFQKVTDTKKFRGIPISIWENTLIKDFNCNNYIFILQ